MRMTPVAINVVAFVLAFTGAVQAAPMTFFGQDTGVFNPDGSPTGTDWTNSRNAEMEFLSNLQDVSTETFESYANGTSVPLAITFPGAGTATLSNAGGIDNNPRSGVNAISGTNFWLADTGSDFTITFDTPVAAFGFYGVDVGDINGQLTLGFSGPSGAVAVNVPHGISSAQNGSVLFFGYIDADNPFTSVTFTNSGTSDGFGFDNFTIGSVEQVRDVPEPSTVALLGLGLAALGFAGFRHRRRSI